MSGTVATKFNNHLNTTVEVPLHEYVRNYAFCSSLLIPKVAEANFRFSFFLINKYI